MHYDSKEHGSGNMCRTSKSLTDFSKTRLVAGLTVPPGRDFHSGGRPLLCPHDKWKICMSHTTIISHELSIYKLLLDIWPLGSSRPLSNHEPRTVERNSGSESRSYCMTHGNTTRNDFSSSAYSEVVVRNVLKCCPQHLDSQISTLSIYRFTKQL